MTLTMRVGSWLMQAAATLPDTIVTKPLVAGSGWFTIVAQIAGGLVSILLLVLVAALVPVALALRKAIARVTALLDKLEGDVAPLVRHASGMADDVHYITTAVRADVADVSRTVHAANERLAAGLTASERRLRELGDLLRLVQDEVEEAVVSAAATVRGVRAGARMFREEAEMMLEDDEPFDDDALADEAEADEAYDDVDAAGAEPDGAEEEDDGYDGAYERSRRGARPRIRPRRDGGSAR